MCHIIDGKDLNLCLYVCKHTIMIGDLPVHAASHLGLCLRNAYQNLGNFSKALSTTRST